MANTFYIDNFYAYAVIDVNVNATALELTLTLEPRTVRLSPNITATALELTLSQKNRTYRSDMDKMTVTALELTLDDKAPAIRLSPNISPDALELTLTQSASTYRSDVDDMTVTALGLSFSLKSITYRHSITIGTEEVLELTLHLPNIILSPNISPDQLDLALSEKDPTYQSDVDDFSVSALNLTLTEPDPTYRSDVDDYTATALALIASLRDPTYTISPTVTITALTLILDLASTAAEVIVKSRILRSGYTFGTTEQVTNAKLHTLIESGQWVISNRTTGDMVYFKDEYNYYQRLGIGNAGEGLRVSGGKPEWTALP